MLYRKTQGVVWKAFSFSLLHRCNRTFIYKQFWIVLCRLHEELRRNIESQMEILRQGEGSGAEREVMQNMRHQLQLLSQVMYRDCWCASLPWKKLFCLVAQSLLPNKGWFVTQSLLPNKGWFVTQSLLSNKGWFITQSLLPNKGWFVTQSLLPNKGWFVTQSLLPTRVGSSRNLSSPSSLSLRRKENRVCY